MVTQNTSLSGDAGVKLIRFGLGSYFLAIAAGVIEGVNPAAALALVMPGDIAAIAGTAMLFVTSFCIMAGRKLRLAALCLVVLVLSASFAQTFLYATGGDISAFWRDVTLLFAVLLAYWAEHAGSIRTARSTPRPARSVAAPRRINSTPMDGAKRTPRPDRPKLRKLCIEMLDGLEQVDMSDQFAQEPAQARAIAQPQMSRMQPDQMRAAQDCNPARTVEPMPTPVRKPKMKLSFKPLPLTSRFDQPDENIFAQI